MAACRDDPSCVKPQFGADISLKMDLHKLKKRGILLCSCSTEKKSVFLFFSLVIFMLSQKQEVLHTKTRSSMWAVVLFSWLSSQGSCSAVTLGYFKPSFFSLFSSALLLLWNMAIATCTLDASNSPLTIRPHVAALPLTQQ